MEKTQEAGPKTLKITLLRRATGFSRAQGKVVEGLGLHRIRHTIERPDTPSIRGMIHKVRHLVHVEE